MVRTAGLPIFTKSRALILYSKYIGKKCCNQSHFTFADEAGNHRTSEGRLRCDVYQLLSTHINKVMFSDVKMSVNYGTIEMPKLSRGAQF